MADTVVCHETQVIWNYIRDVINDLKNGFFPRAGYLPSTVVFA